MKENKPKKCKNCGKQFNPFNSLQRACGAKCENELRTKKQQGKKMDRGKVKTASKAHYTQLASMAVNKFIRFRDRGKPCISCGAKWRADFQAGHLFSGGGHSSVRFDELNINAQCVECNSGSNFDQGAYITELIRRTSAEEFEEMKARAYEVKSYSIEELNRIVLTYKKKLIDLENEK